MRIKITCTQAEFAQLVRKCECVNNGYSTSCAGCVLEMVCQERGDQARIEHIVDIVLDEGGAVNG